MDLLLTQREIFQKMMEGGEDGAGVINVFYDTNYRVLEPLAEKAGTKIVKK